MLLSAVTLLLASIPETSWPKVLQNESSWYSSAEASRIGDQLLLFQLEEGGWGKNFDMAKPITAEEIEVLLPGFTKYGATIDNGGTWLQLIYLAKLFTATEESKYSKAFNRGIDYLLKAQYENGGWPQFYPITKGYQKHITYNDGAMTGVLFVLQLVAEGEGDYVFVDSKRRKLARIAVEKGVSCILKTQVRVNGKLTVWCAQHDSDTFEPAPARNFEPLSLSGQESMYLLAFLMTQDISLPGINEAIEAGVSWYDSVKIEGIRIDRVDTDEGSKKDKIVVADPNAEAVWARFYEIGTNRPIFTGRDKVIKYVFSEIEYERRSGYGYYGTWPKHFLRVDYKHWSRDGSQSTSTMIRHLLP